MNLKYIIVIYLFLLILLYILKPHIFDLNVENKKRKFLYLVFLVIILSIISFYSKVIIEYFL